MGVSQEGHLAAAVRKPMACDGERGTGAAEHQGVRTDRVSGLPSAARAASGPVFVVPFDPTRLRRPVAGLFGAAGLTLAARERHGHAWLLSPAGWLNPREVQAASQGTPQARPRAGIAARLPLVFKTALKDALRLVEVARLNRSLGSVPLPSVNPPYIWQRHELGFVAGERLARRTGAPFVVSVHAALVREGERWGVRRPLWGLLLERLCERRILRRAEVVTCVSDEVAEDVRRLGLPSDRVVVVPNGVDTEVFVPDRGREHTRGELGISSDAFVIGWLGSFHRFHDLDILLEAVARLGRVDVVLLLVGSGHDLARVRARASELGIAACTRFTGAVAHIDVPRHLNAMDVAVLVTAAERHYHYSPLKLREYMACGRPVIAPDIGEPARLLNEGRDALLVPPGDPEALSATIMRLVTDGALRRELGRRARERAVAEWSWKSVLVRIEDAIERQGRNMAGAARMQP
ncbi:MAG: glycosyltransferase [Nitriliruptorales bacterium]